MAPVYHRCLLALPLFLVLLWWKLHDAANLPGLDPLTEAITNHAGGWFFNSISTHLLVATHTFLEMVHYGIWILAMPLIGMRSAPSNSASRSPPPAGRTPGATASASSCFSACSSWSFVGLLLARLRHHATVYFTVALLHVLAEIPFLLRMV